VAVVDDMLKQQPLTDYFEQIRAYDRVQPG
jgi:hypothetical protein